MTHLIRGRVTHVDHHPYTQPYSILTVECREPYRHATSVKVSWCPVIYPHHPGEEFCNALADAGDVVIAASLNDDQLEAHRSDIFVAANQYLGR